MEHSTYRFSFSYVLTPWVKRLLVANAVVFVITLAAPEFFYEWFAFAPAKIITRPWGIVTYMFLHGSFWHLFFNMLVLFFFGPKLEAKLGGSKFVRLYFVSGLMGAALSMLFAIGPPIRIVGASGAVYGVLLAFAMLWPRDAIYIWGVVPIQARWLVGVMTAITVYQGFGGAQDGVAHFAHLGGFLGGYLYMRRLERNAPHRKFKDRMYADAKRKPAMDGQDAQRWGRIQLDGLHEVNRDEVERLQTKIKEVGVASLALDERAFLNRFSRQ